MPEEEHQIEVKPSRIEREMKTIRSEQAEKKEPTWANVASGRYENIGEEKSVIRIRLHTPPTTTEDDGDILQKVKNAIPEAVAIKKLRSGDIEVSVRDLKTKDEALTRTGYEGLKVLRQDYSVEVPGVPFDLIEIREGRTGGQQGTSQRNPNRYQET